MGMLLPLVVSLFFYYRPVLSKKNLRRRLVEFFNQDCVNINFLLGFFTLLMATIAEGSCPKALE